MTDKVAQRPYIGVTGIMSAEQARNVINEYRAAWDGRPETHDLMLGVLASAKTIRGEANRWPLRYPKRDAIADIFISAPGVVNLIHYAGNFTSDESTEAQRTRLNDALDCAGASCDGAQLNGEWPRVTLASMRLVMQTRTLALSANDRPDATDLLLDMSGGKGVAADIGVAVQSLRHSPWARGIGIAGGFCADFLPPRWVFGEHPQLSIDAEGQLRDGPDGGTLNMDKVRAYLRAAVAVVASV